jgi:hypothetical protein
VGVPAGTQKGCVGQAGQDKTTGKTRRWEGQDDREDKGKEGTYVVLDLGFASTEIAFGSGAGGEKSKAVLEEGDHPSRSRLRRILMAKDTYMHATLGV